MAKLKNLPDQEIIRLLKRNEEKVLLTLFERNFLDTKLLVEKYDLPEDHVQVILGDAVLILWEYFHNNSWDESRHKLDFMITYLVTYLISHKIDGREIKQKHSFPEIDDYIKHHLMENDDAEVSKVLMPYLKHAKEVSAQALCYHGFEKWSDEFVADVLDIRHEDLVEEKRHKAIKRTIDLVLRNYPYQNLIESK